ncbi:MAG: aldolase [Alphaproteobacteria bacterium]|nr:aldolase [Alphaproteobacteria bacterium]
MASATDDRARNHVQEKLRRDELVTSMIVRLVRSIEIVRLAKTAGFDTIYVDLEHNSFSLETTGQICLAALATGVTPFVRVPAVEPQFVSRLLDAGALGVIAPHVNSAQEAGEIVRWAKYPPRGERSVAGLLPQLGYRALPMAETQGILDGLTTVVAMVETAAAVERADEIAAVEGVDMLLIGAGDLSTDLGVPGQADHPRMDDAHRRVIEACRKRGKHAGLGGLAARPDLIARYVGLGARYVSAGSDLDLLMKAATERAAMVAAIPRQG